MHRLARWTLNALTVLSLLLCVATAGLWVRSRSTCDALYIGNPTGDWGVVSCHGAVLWWRDSPITWLSPYPTDPLTSWGTGGASVDPGQTIVAITSGRELSRLADDMLRMTGCQGLYECMSAHEVPHQEQAVDVIGTHAYLGNGASGGRGFMKGQTLTVRDAQTGALAGTAKVLAADGVGWAGPVDLLPGWSPSRPYAASATADGFGLHRRVDVLGVHYASGWAWGLWRRCGAVGYLHLSGVFLVGITPGAIQSWRASRRGRLRRVGACPNCSYDLTGNVSGVCPECGAAIPKPASAG